LALLSLHGTEVIGKESLLYRPKLQEQTDLQRLDGFDSLLTTIETWFTTFAQIPLSNFIGIPYNIHTQFSHCMKILFKLTTLNEPGWETTEVRKRIDIITVLEDVAEKFERLPHAMGLEGAFDLVDAVMMEESGIFFRAAPPLIRSMRAKFAAELSRHDLQSNDIANLIDGQEDAEMDFANDPWLTQLFESLHEADFPQWN
jgi:hypothetical protein